MNKDELEVYNSLLLEGYDEDFAQLCVDNMVDEDRIIGEVVGFFEEIYHSRMSQVEEATDGMKDFVSYCIKERLSTMCASFYSDEYFTTGMNLLMDYGLYKTIFSINGSSLFVIFENEEDAPEEGGSFINLSDYIIFNHEAMDKIVKGIESFKWKDEAKVEEVEEEATSNSIRSMDAYNVAVRWLKDNKENENYEKVSLLVNQYNFGYSVHRELEECLEEMGIEFKKS